MSKTYTASARHLTALPRNKRLREAGVTSGTAAADIDATLWGQKFSGRGSVTGDLDLGTGRLFFGGEGWLELVDGALHTNLPIVSDSFISGFAAEPGEEQPLPGLSTIETIKVNGTPLIIDDDRAVNIPIPTSITDFHDAGEFARLADLSTYATRSYVDGTFAKTAWVERYYATVFDLPQKLSDLRNDLNFVTQSDVQNILDNSQFVTSSALESYVPAARKIAGIGLSADVSASALASAIRGSLPFGDYVPKSGSTQMSGTFRPSSNKGSSLGTSSYRFSNIYGNLLNLSGSLDVSGPSSLKGGLDISGGSSDNVFWVSDGVLHCRLPIVSESYIAGYGATE